METTFEAEVVYWRGPAPFVFALLPAAVAADVQALAPRVSYGWGCIPVVAIVEGVEFTTALMPRQGSYMLPLKVAARRKMRPIEIGERVGVVMRIALEAGREMN